MKAIMLKHGFILVLMLIFMPDFCLAQNDRTYIRSGNKFFYGNDYPSAEVQYRKAISVNPDNPQALYNLGCALMMQNKSSEAVKLYEKAASLETSKLRRAKIYHNIGVVCQSGKMYDEAIKAYAESLRNNPYDNETRYNLALCKKLRKKNKNNKGQNPKQNNNSNKGKGKGNKQQQKEKSEQNKNEQKNSQQPQMSKDNAEQLLNAAMQQEQETQQKLSKNRQQQQTKHLDKNW